MLNKKLVCIAVLNYLSRVGVGFYSGCLHFWLALYFILLVLVTPNARWT